MKLSLLVIFSSKHPTSFFFLHLTTLHQPSGVRQTCTLVLHFLVQCLLLGERDGLVGLYLFLTKTKKGFKKGVVNFFFSFSACLLSIFFYT